MRKLTITSANGLSMEISRTNPYILQKLSGEGTPNSETEALKSPNQDGSTYIQTLFTERELEIEVAILESDFGGMFTLREEVCRILNPKYALTLLYEYPGGVKKILGHLAGAVSFPRGGQRGYQKAAFTIECNNPFWTDESLIGKKLAVSAPKFHFPLVFAPKIVFSEILNKSVVVDNVGHVPAPVRIQFFGATTNPIITNETTGEFIKVNKTLLSGEILEINTAFGNKYVTIDGVNAFGFIDPESTFFNLAPGENTITYDADSGSDSAEVILTYTNRYTGV